MENKNERLFIEHHRIGHHHNPFFLQFHLFHYRYCRPILVHLFQENHRHRFLQSHPEDLDAIADIRKVVDKVCLVLNYLVAQNAILDSMFGVAHHHHYPLQKIFY